ncbi:MAG: phosphatidylserine decarboxylase family protein [Elusimicrobia bacterium]|nr:phosphatidylserine decarboxylase family protein [Elusimicrobiota bacterium]
MKIAKQGYWIIATGLFAGSLGLLPMAGAAGWGVMALGYGFAAFSIYFFRDPERPLPTDEGKIYSPGDGKVMSVAKEGPGDTVTVRIFLSVFDVHVQRNAVSGTVSKVHYQPGAFKAAMVEEAKHNERNIVTIDCPGRGPVIVEQIAGLIARRIEGWVKPGDVVKAGERYGIIYFGSQCAVHLPAGARATVKPGDRVAGGLSEIGEWIKKR